MSREERYSRVSDTEAYRKGYDGIDWSKKKPKQCRHNVIEQIETKDRFGVYAWKMQCVKCGKTIHPPSQ